MYPIHHQSFPCHLPGRTRLVRRPSLAVFSIFSLVALLASSVLPAQSPPPYIQLTEHEIDPSKLQDYVPAMKQIQAVLSHHKYPLRATQAWNNRSSVGVSYVFPLQSMADLDRANAATDALIASGDSKIGDAVATMSDTLLSTSTTLLRFRGDLSYEPEKPWVLANERNFLRLEYAFVKPGKEAAFEAALEAWRAAVEKRNSGQGYVVFQQAVGPEGPLFVVGSASRNEADLAAEIQKVEESLGSELAVLAADFLETTRRYEVRYAERNHELSPALGAADVSSQSKP